MSASPPNRTIRRRSCKRCASPRSPVDIATGPQNVTFTFEASDDLLGVSNGSLRIINPYDTTISTVSFDSNQRVSGNGLFGIYQVTARIPDNQGWGTWRVEVDLVEATTGEDQILWPGQRPVSNTGRRIFHGFEWSHR